jgi:hypothetical protein
MPLRKINHLQEIISTLAMDEIDFIICGGVALVLHGIERMTMDLDLSVNMSDHNLKRFLGAMKRLGLTPRAPVPADSLLDPEKRKVMVDEKNALVFTFIDTKNPYRQVDIFITDSLSYETLKEHAEHIRVGDHLVQLINKNGLLKMKRAINPPRDKDVYDIHMLTKILEKQHDD